MENKRGQWTSSFGFILASIGSAIGMGNLWGFPYKMGANGGFPFLIIYMIMVIACGVVVMGVEMTIGRHTGKSPILALSQLSKKFKIIGIFGVMCSFLITGFYSVLIGYSIRYAFGFAKQIFGVQGFEGLGGADFFGAYTSDVLSVFIFTVICYVVCWIIVSGGISNGIEKFSKVCTPALFVILIAIIIYNLTLPGAKQGLAFMFSASGMEIAGTKFNFFNAVRTAGGQMLFSLSLGMGCMITYGSYLGKEENISTSAWLIPAIDTLAALLAGLAIFPAVFAMGQAPNAGPGLLFITMHNTFTSMGYVGNFVGFLFYLLVIFAGVTSAISLIEVSTASMVDGATAKGKNPNRRKITFFVCLGMLIISTLVCFDQLGKYTGWLPFAESSRSFLDLLDFIAEGVLMPLGSVMMCILVGWVLKKDWLSNEITLNGNKFYTKNFFTFFVKYVTPVLMTFVLISLVLSFFGL